MLLVTGARVKVGFGGSSEKYVLVLAGEDGDALGAHARDELAINDLTKAQPILAALTSAGTFTAGALDEISRPQHQLRRPHPMRSLSVSTISPTSL
mgnify:CR=1 FL=1